MFQLMGAHLLLGGFIAAIDGVCGRLCWCPQDDKSVREQLEKMREKNFWLVYSDPDDSQRSGARYHASLREFQEHVRTSQLVSRGPPGDRALSAAGCAAVVHARYVAAHVARQLVCVLQRWQFTAARSMPDSLQASTWLTCAALCHHPY